MVDDARIGLESYLRQLLNISDRVGEDYDFRNETGAWNHEL